MNDFTTYNGYPVTSSKYILQDLLRDELKFNGCLVTDWACIEQLPKHRVVKDDEAAAKKALELGIDIDMQADCYYEHLEKVIKENPSLLEKLDESVTRVLEMKEKMQLFTHPYVLENAYEVLSKENRELCLQAALESIVLLKNNDNVLPLKKDDKILLIGPYVEEKDSHLGAWACKGNKVDVISIKEAFENHPNVSYLPTSFELNELEDPKFIKKLKSIAKKVDKIIVLVGEPRYMSGENNNRISINLPFNQENLIKYLSKFNKPLVTVVTSGRPLALEEVDNLSTALIFTYQLGIEAGNAYYQILTGKTNPSGKLTMTFPRYLGQVPIYYNRFSTGRIELVHYVDGSIEPLYYFGDGLHYGDVSIDNIVMHMKNKILKIDYQINNASSYEIKEVVQAYLHIPYYQKLRPEKEFIGFEKVTIKEKTSQNKSLTIDLNNVLPLDIETEEIVIMIGNSSHNTKEFKVKIN